MSKGWFSKNFSYVGSFVNEDGAEGYKYVFNDDILTIREEIKKQVYRLEINLEETKWGSSSVPKE